MPQMNKGGKFILGISTIRENGMVQIPTQAMGAKGPLLEKSEHYEGEIPYTAQGKKTT